MSPVTGGMMGSKDDVVKMGLDFRKASLEEVTDETNNKDLLN